MKCTIYCLLSCIDIDRWDTECEIHFIYFARTRANFGCLSSDQKLLTSLLTETGWSERNKDEEDGDRVTLPIEWVVDIADKDGDWFIGTATGYNDAKQTLHVMVPDRDAPSWTGDVSVNPLVRPCFPQICCQFFVQGREIEIFVINVTNTYCLYIHINTAILLVLLVKFRP